TQTEEHTHKLRQSNRETQAYTHSTSSSCVDWETSQSGVHCEKEKGEKARVGEREREQPKHIGALLLNTHTLRGYWKSGLTNGGAWWLGARSAIKQRLCLSTFIPA